jgi:hypothetical protein
MCHYAQDRCAITPAAYHSSRTGVRAEVSVRRVMWRVFSRTQLGNGTESVEWPLQESRTPMAELVHQPSETALHSHRQLSRAARRSGPVYFAARLHRRTRAFASK